MDGRPADHTVCHAACHTVFVVFGATGGIGSALCHRLSKHEGAAVVMVGRDQAKLDGLRALLPPATSSATLVADVTDSKSVSSMSAQARGEPVKQEGAR